MGDSTAAPTRQEIEEVTRLVSGIVRQQGNRFIKKLLRDRQIPIGRTKDDFERNLLEAVGDGRLRLADVAAWSEEVEGWGDQHVYLYAVHPDLEAAVERGRIQRRARAAGLADKLDAPTILAFPDEPELTSISVDDTGLRLVWEEGAFNWVREPELDREEDIGLDHYEFRAYRQVEERALTRFEVRRQMGLAALFVAKPIQGGEHETARAEARRVLEALGVWGPLAAGELDISVLARDLDQRNVTGDQPGPITTTLSRLTSGGAYVEFGTSSADGGYGDVTPVREVRKAIRSEQIADFRGDRGTFRVGPGVASLDRILRVSLYAADNRIRLWAQMSVDEVWMILAEVARRP